MGIERPSAVWLTTNAEPGRVYHKIFGSAMGGQILRTIENIYVSRVKPEINTVGLDEMIIEEKGKLKMIYDSLNN